MIASQAFKRLPEMGDLFTRRTIAIMAIVAFLACSTAAVAHGHSDGRSADESHCALCIAAHTATHAIASATVTLTFTTIQNAVLADTSDFFPALFCSLLHQDRAPPVS
jgi:hypothetical protein